MIRVRRWMALAALVGCAELPALDRTGALVAGAAGECPAGFVARLGRCCPADSSTVVCPSGPGFLGGQCAQNSDCVSAETTRACLNGQPVGMTPTPAFPNGYCSESCMGRIGQLTPCANGAGVCVGALNTGACLRRCELPAGRSDGPCPFRPNDAALYRCVQVDTGDTTAICLPNCLAPNVNCLTTQRCVPLPSDPNFGICRARL